MPGYAPNEQGLTLAFLWENGQPHNLNMLIGANSGWYISFATDINESGQIICLGSQSYGSSPLHALLLTPLTVVPEPGASSILSSLAFASVIALRRRIRGYILRHIK